LLAFGSDAWLVPAPLSEHEQGDEHEDEHDDRCDGRCAAGEFADAAYYVACGVAGLCLHRAAGAVGFLEIGFLVAEELEAEADGDACDDEADGAVAEFFEEAAEAHCHAIVAPCVGVGSGLSCATTQADTGL